MRFERTDAGVLFVSLAVFIGTIIAVPGSSSSLDLTSIDLARFEIRDETAVDINRATAKELQALDGIGPVLAQRILQYRVTHGPILEYSKLTEIKGIGDGLLGKLRPSICLGYDCVE